jgi:hypothetical protein
VVEATGSLVDVTNLLHPVLVDGAAQLQLRLHAGSGPAGTVALALYRGDGSLAVAVSWDGSGPLPQPLLSGQINVS